MEYNLTELSKEVHKQNKNKGFYDEHEELTKFLKDSNAPQHLIKSYIKAFIDQRLALVTTESSEAVEANRKDKHTVMTWNMEKNIPLLDMASTSDQQYFNQEFEVAIKDTFEDEIADTIIRLLDLAGYMEIDIQYHIDNKLLYNSLRPKKHGKNY